jgi:hypothetical protein
MTPSEQLDPKARTLWVPVPRDTAIAVVRIIAFRPLTVETYRRAAEAAAREAKREEYVAIFRATGQADNPLSYPRLVERHKYVPVRGDSGEEEPAAPPAGPAAPVG